jgi:DsbC/DsbD-like thiol-disulfide interchange protein
MLGVPYPGVFMLDRAGVVVEKRFEQSYRVRPTAASLLEGTSSETGVSAATQARAQTDALQVVAWFGSPTYRTYQRLRLNLAIQIAPGLHVYADPVPAGYTPLTVEVDPLETLEVGPLELPAPRPFRVEGLDEQFFVYEDTIRGGLTLTLYKNLGEIAVNVRLHYQACDERSCFPPAEVNLSLALVGLDHIRE